MEKSFGSQPAEKPPELQQRMYKDFKKYVDMDLDELLDQLTPEELDMLEESELSDPDNSMLPACNRVRDQTKKSATGKYERQKLLKFLEDKAKHEEDWDETKPFAKETRGKVWVPKELSSMSPERSNGGTRGDDDMIGVDLPDDYENALNSASEAELIDLAGVLELHSMLTQTQYWASYAKGSIEQDPDTSFRGPAKTAKIKAIPDEPPNMTDVEGSIEKIKNNDSSVSSLNLNNIKNIDIDKLVELAEAIKCSRQLEELSMASVGATDTVAKELVSALESNSSLKSLNLESNFISPAYVKEIIRAASKNQSVTELRLSNQRSATLGVKTEMEICKILQENEKILKLGLTFDVGGARVKVAEILKRNNDCLRKDRVEQEDSPSYRPYMKKNGKDFDRHAASGLKPVPLRALEAHDDGFRPSSYHKVADELEEDEVELS